LISGGQSSRQPTSKASETGPSRLNF
jgi:hypothetical protein